MSFSACSVSLNWCIYITYKVFIVLQWFFNYFFSRLKKIEIPIFCIFSQDMKKSFDQYSLIYNSWNPEHVHETYVTKVECWLPLQSRAKRRQNHNPAPSSSVQRAYTSRHTRIVSSTAKDKHRRYLWRVFPWAMQEINTAGMLFHLQHKEVLLYSSFHL